jgi:hypothetical protein
MKEQYDTIPYRTWIIYTNMKKNHTMTSRSAQKDQKLMETTIYDGHATTTSIKGKEKRRRGRSKRVLYNHKISKQNNSKRTIFHIPPHGVMVAMTLTN